MNCKEIISEINNLPSKVEIYFKDLNFCIIVYYKGNIYLEGWDDSFESTVDQAVKFSKGYTIGDYYSVSSEEVERIKEIKLTGQLFWSSDEL